MRQFHFNWLFLFSKEHRTEVMVAIFCIFISAVAHSQTWEYKAYPDGKDVRVPLDKSLSPGYITLDESGAAPIFRMYAGTVTTCFSGPIEAKVEKTLDTTMIVVRRDLRGCGSARFVLKNDGTGGRRELLRGGKWVWDGLERGLTLRK